MEPSKLAIVIAATAAATAVGASASAGGSGAGGSLFDHRTPPGCFFVDDIGDRTVGGPHTLYFKVKDQSHMHAVAYFHLETKGYCNTGPTSNDEHHAYRIITTEVHAHRSGIICNPNEVMIYAASYCPLASMELMTPQEVAALPKGIKP